MKVIENETNKASDVENARGILQAQGYTCVICRGDEIYTTNLRGVRPLVKWLHEGLTLNGFSAADKVVGRATAFLYCLLGVKALYAGVISKSALAVLQSQGISVQYDELAENIINRKGDGICPFEAAVMNVQDVQEALAVIRRKMQEMNIPL